MYEFECPNCHKHEEVIRTISDRDEVVICKKCNIDMFRVYMGGSISIWKPITLEHIADQPMTFNSKRDLRKYCREHKLSSGALL